MDLQKSMTLQDRQTDRHKTENIQERLVNAALDSTY